LLVSAARRGNERGLYAGPLTLSSPKMRFISLFFHKPEYRLEFPPPNSSVTDRQLAETREMFVIAGHV